MGYILCRRLIRYPKHVKTKKIGIQPIINNEILPVTPEEDDEEGLPPDNNKLD